MNLIKEGEETKSKGRWANLGMFIGLVLLLVYMCYAATISTGTSLSFFVDVPSALIILGITVLVLALSGKLKYFFLGFKYALVGYPDNESFSKCKKAMKLAMASNILSAIFGSVTGVIAFLVNMSDISSIGPNLAVVVLSLFYGALFNIIILVFYGKLD